MTRLYSLFLFFLNESSPQYLKLKLRSFAIEGEMNMKVWLNLTKTTEKTSMFNFINTRKKEALIKSAFAVD